jgi:16S rRNA (uracil1498-N3)-methyltransferase
MPRLHCSTPLASGLSLPLPPGTARHVQVLRMQPGQELTLFDGSGGEYQATIERMGRSDVQVLVGVHHAIEREAAREVHLALGVPANERMDWLVEKATELGAMSIQPLLAERSVLKLSGERAEKKRAHWEAIAIAACEQCGRNRVPVVHEALPLAQWLAARPVFAGRSLVLSLQVGTQPLLQAANAPAASDAEAAAASRPQPVYLLSGPEGGLAPAEEAAALARGFTATHLGPRVLRAETAPLAALAAFAACDASPLFATTPTA